LCELKRGFVYGSRLKLHLCAKPSV